MNPNDATPATSSTRRQFIARAGAGAAAAAAMPNILLRASLGATGDRRPNIIFLQSDDSTWQTMGPYSSYVKWTPNFDRLAREGMTFDSCHCQNALCSPARATMLTGKMSHINGVPDNFTPFDGRQQTFPKMLQDSGYQTAMIGKWHLHSFPTGFDYYNVLDGQGIYYNCPFIENEKRVIRPGYCDTNSRDIGLEWLKNRDPNKPFMLIQSFKASHRCWIPSPERMQSLEDVEFPEPETLFDDAFGRAQAYKGQEERIYENLVNPLDLKVEPHGLPGMDQALWDAAYSKRRAEWPRIKNLRGPERLRWLYHAHMQDYARMIATLDDQIGYFLRYLDENNLADNTIVIFSSDHGMFVGEHGMFDKRFMYEQAFRIPFFVRWPGMIKPGSRNDDLVQNIDYAPTILEAVGLPVPEDMQGRSLMSLLRGETPADWRRSLYYHFYEYGSDHLVFKHEGVADRRHKLMNFYGQREWEYYDRETDPHEVNNRIKDPACAATVAELKAELERLRRHYRLPPNGPMGWVNGNQDMRMLDVNRRLRASQS